MIVKKMTETITKTKEASVDKKLGMSLDELITQNVASKKVASGGPIRTIQNKRNQRNSPYSNQGSQRRNGVAQGNRIVTKTGGANFEKHMYTIKVTNIPYVNDQKELENLLKGHFGVCGKVISINIRKPGMAYVGFESAQSCSQALAELQQSKIRGHTLHIERGNPIPSRQGKNGNIGNNNAFQLQRSEGGMANIEGRLGLAYRGGVMSNQGYGVYGADGIGMRAYVIHPGQASAYVNNSNNFGGLVQSGTASSSGLLTSYSPAYSHDSLTGNSIRNSTYIFPPQPVATLTGKGQATVVVSNVPEELTAQEVQDAFSCVGTVTRTEVLLNSSGVHTGRVAVTFQDKQSALEAVKRFDGGDLNSNTIRVFLE